ncbi:MAG TPA: GntR family transcriptional regulator [Burkholderiaceae bacterium]|nr:GntR family transcriptional regulator [Burkholderiaceae bacterium]
MNQTINLAAAIRAAIQEGELSPGSHLSEFALAQRFRASRTPVRNALSLLAAEDLVIFRPNRGYVVRSMSAAEIQGRLRVRAAMEGLAARIVAVRGLTHAERVQLRGALAECADVAAKPDIDPESIDRYLQSVAQFHQVLRQGCGNALLCETIERSQRFPYDGGAGVRWVEHEALVSSKTPVPIIPAAVLDRHRIYDAIEERNGMRAETLLREHMFMISQGLAALL